MKRDAPATLRNREPILEVLARWLPGSARVLEVASGTGQHAAFFAARLPAVAWQPSDVHATDFESIEAWASEVPEARVHAPIVLDATREQWPTEDASFDALFNANMIHISAWVVALGLFRGAGRKSGSANQYGNDHSEDSADGNSIFFHFKASFHRQNGVDFYL